MYKCILSIVTLGTVCQITFGSVEEDLKTKALMKGQLTEVLKENHRLLFEQAGDQKPKLEHLDRYFNQRLEMVQIEQQSSIEKLETEYQAKRTLEQQQVLNALADLELQKKPSDTIADYPASAEDFLRSILQIRNMLSREPEMSKNLYAVLPGPTVLLWQQSAFKKGFKVQTEKILQFPQGDTKALYVIGCTDEGRPIILRASVEKNAETNRLFVSNWTETQDTHLVKRLKKHLEAKNVTKA